MQPGQHMSWRVSCALCWLRTTFWFNIEHRNVLIPTSQMHSVWPVLEAAILVSVLVS